MLKMGMSYSSYRPSALLVRIEIHRANIHKSAISKMRKLILLYPIF